MTNLLSLEIRTKKLGVLIQDARLSSGKSPELCAEAMGVAASTFAAYENGELAPSLPELEVLAYLLDIPLAHFWGQASISREEKERIEASKLEDLLPLRHRIIGVLLRKERTNIGYSLEQLARETELPIEKLEAYELGQSPVPLPEFELIISALRLPIRDFQDKNGPVGRWEAQKQTLEAFAELPLEMQQFVSKPINQPYLELAVRLSEMSVDRLRAVAEGLLEITL